MQFKAQEFAQKIREEVGSDYEIILKFRSRRPKASFAHGRDLVVSLETFQHMCGVSRETLYQWRKVHGLPVTSAKQINLEDALKWLVERRRKLPPKVRTARSGPIPFVRGLRICPKCGKPKEVHQWGKNTHSPDGFAAACKECIRQYGEKQKNKAANAQQFFQTIAMAGAAPASKESDGE